MATILDDKELLLQVLKLVALNARIGGNYAVVRPSKPSTREARGRNQKKSFR